MLRQKAIKRGNLELTDADHKESILAFLKDTSMHKRRKPKTILIKLTDSVRIYSPTPSREKTKYLPIIGVKNGRQNLEDPEQKRENQRVGSLISP